MALVGSSKKLGELNALPKQIDDDVKKFIGVVSQVASRRGLVCKIAGYSQNHDHWSLSLTREGRKSTVAGMEIGLTTPQEDEGGLYVKGFLYEPSVSVYLIGVPGSEVRYVDLKDPAGSLEKIFDAYQLRKLA